MAPKLKVTEETPLAYNEYTEVISTDGAITDVEEEDEDLRMLRDAHRHHATLHWLVRPSLPYLFIIITVFMTAVSISMSSRLILLLDKSCESVGATDCRGSPEVQKLISQLNMITGLLQSIMTSLVSGKLCEFSDRYGRKPVLIFAAATFTIGQVMIVYLLVPGTKFTLTRMILAVLVESVSGGMNTLLALCNSYVADVVSPEARTAAMSKMVSPIYASLGFGPLFGSWLVSKTGRPIDTLYCTVALLFLCVLLMVVLPESRHENARRKSRVQRRESQAIKPQWTSIGSIINLLSPLKQLWLPRVNGSLVPRYMVLNLLAIAILSTIANGHVAQPLLLWVTYKFNFDAVAIGELISIQGIGSFIFMFFIAPRIISWLETRHSVYATSLDHVDTIVIKSSLIVINGSLLLLLLKTPSSVYLFIGVQCLAASLTPTLQSAVLKYGSKSKVGEIFGAMTLLSSLVSLIIPPLMMTIYSQTVSFNWFVPPFLILPLVTGVGSLFLSLLLRVGDAEV